MESNFGQQTAHASCVAGTGQGPCQHTYICECRTTLSGSGKKSQTEHSAAARAVLQCPHRMLWPRSVSLWAATTRDEARQGHNQHMLTRGLRRIKARGYGSQRMSSHPTISRWQQMRGKWLLRMGITAAAGERHGAVPPGACTPHSLNVVAGLGVQSCP